MWQHTKKRKCEAEKYFCYMNIDKTMNPAKGKIGTVSTFSSQLESSLGVLLNFLQLFDCLICVSTQSVG